MTEPPLLDLLEAVQNKCDSAAESMRRSLGISPAEFRGLHVISPDEELTCQEFSMRMGLSLSRGSRVIDQLTRRGLLIRRSCSTDRRCKSLRLSQKGVLNRRKITQQRWECEEHLRTVYSSRAWEALKFDINRLLDNL